ncbi:hypothetical protein M0R45_022852 [Rubus argutus]|uniref:Uncharacterized protein n=1 Tax=Rubus argutus TaxID=59490 RepID=A0AAW1XGZ0_RUBAR
MDDDSIRNKQLMRANYIVHMNVSAMPRTFLHIEALKKTKGFLSAYLDKPLICSTTPLTVPNSSPSIRPTAYGLR